MSTAGSNILARRIAVLALSVASFTAVERSHAQVPPANSCSPPAPVNNTNVTCSGTVTNQNAPNGYGTGTETGLTIDVLTGATVSGTQRGIFIDTATVTNNGSISAAGNTDARGISASTDVNVTNFGTITVGDSLTTAVAGVGVRALTATVNNLGTITAGANSIGVAGAVVSLTNSGLIQAAADGTGILAGSQATVINHSTGVISAGVVGITTGGAANVTNDGGTIQGTGTNSTGIQAFGDATVTNNVNGSSIGRIFGTRFGIDAETATNPSNATVTNNGVILAGDVTTAGTGIHATGTATVSNTGDGITTGIISATKFGIDAGTVIVTANTGEIEGNGVDGRAIRAAGDANVTNAGVIRANTSGGVAISAGGTVAVNNTVNGTVIGAISGNLFGIDATSATVTNNGVISSGNGTAIHVTGTATVSNTGDGINTGIIGGAGAGITAGMVNVGTNAGFIFGNSSDAINATIGSANITSNGGIIQSFGLNSAAIRAATDATVNNSGTIQANVSGGHAIDAATATVNNSGTITANGIDGVAVFTLGATDVVNSGTIQASGAFRSAVVSVNGAVTANNSTSGVITGGSNGVIANNNTVDVVNAGLIETTVSDGTAISGRTATVNNSGIIRATAPVGLTSHAAIEALDSAGASSVSNTGNGTTTGVISAGRFGIVGAKGDVTNNGGLIEATGTIGIAVSLTDATVSNNVNGSSIGRIFGTLFGIGATNANVTNSGVIGIGNTGTSDTAIHANGTATVSNTGDGTTTGIIRGTAFGVDAGTVDVKSNTGRIEAVGANAIAINAATDATVNNAGTIQGGLFGIFGQTVNITLNSGTTSANASAITAETVNVTSNSGTIEATADLVGGIAGRAINGAVVSVTNSGTIRENGVGGRAIDASRSATSQATVNNLAGGKIIADGANGTAINAANANVTNAGTIQSATNLAIRAENLDVTNFFGGTISGGTAGIEGSGIVRNAGKIDGGVAVNFTGTGTNTLILQTGSELIGNAMGSAASTNNNLILQGSGTASNNFLNFNTLDVQAGGTWVWNSNGSGTFGQTTVGSGTFAVDGLLFSPVSVNSGAVLAGRGAITGAVSAAGTIAPGAAVPFSTLTVQGNVDFAGGSFYRVNIGAAGQNDKLQLAGGGAANLSGGTVNVLAQNGFALSSPYTILTATGGLGGTTFSGFTSSLASAFIQPTLTYDANNVFLTLALLNNGGGTGFGFASVAQTPNQIAVATALDAGPQTSSLIAAVLTQAIAGARQAFDALSGEIFGSLHTAQAEVAQFARSGMLGRMRQISYAGLPGELGALGFGGPQLAYASADANAGLPVKAAPGPRETGRDLTFWAQGLGGWGRTDSDGNAASLSTRFGGFLSGADARFGDTLRAGLVAGYVRSDVDVTARGSSAGIDSVQLGAYAAGRLGAFNLRGGASWSFDSIDVSRGIFFPDFTDKTKASFHGNVGQVFGEVGYGMALGHVAVEPLAGLAYVHLRDGSFLESGGIAALSGASANDNIGYSWLGVRAATAVPLANGTVLVPRATLQWQHAFGDVTPNAALAFQATGTAFTVAGIPIARDAALVEAGFDWRFSPRARLGAFYQGELAAHAQTHAVKGAFTWGF